MTNINYQNCWQTRNKINLRLATEQNVEYVNSMCTYVSVCLYIELTM